MMTNIFTPSDSMLFKLTGMVIGDFGAYMNLTAPYQEEAIRDYDPKSVQAQLSEATINEIIDKVQANRGPAVLNRKYYVWDKQSSYYKKFAELMPSIENLNTTDPIISMWVTSFNNFTTSVEDNSFWVYANITFWLANDINHPVRKIQFDVNNVRTKLDLQWLRSFITWPYGYGEETYWYGRLIEYDLTSMSTVLNLTVTNVTVNPSELDNLVRNFPSRSVITQATWRYRPFAKIPYKFTPTGS